jgi:hypothetical protein
MALLNSDKYTRAESWMDMFKVTQLAVPEMVVHVNQGTVLHDNHVVNFDEQDSVPITAPRLGSWLVVLSIDAHGQLVYTYGVQSVNAPTFPRLPDDCLHLAMILVTADTEAITDEDIFDMRQLFGFSINGGAVCQCKCAALDNVLTDEDKAQLKNYFDQYEALRLEIEKLKLLHGPQYVLRMLSDSGIEYELRCHDDGELYTVRVGDPLIDGQKPSDNRILDYRFCLAGTTLNIVAGDPEDYVPMQIDVRSINASNDSAKVTLVLQSRGVRFYGANYPPQYRENEFRVSGLDIDRAGLHEQFSLNFRTRGDHILRLTLLDELTGGVIDDVTALMRVRFSHANHCMDGCLCGDDCTCMQED